MSAGKKGRFCMVPFVALSTRGNGMCRVCCSFQGHYSGVPKGADLDQHRKEYGDNSIDYPHFNLKKDSIESVWNSQFYRDLRMKMIRGEYISNCEHCYRVEDFGFASKRVSRNKNYADHKQALISEAKANDGILTSFPKWWELRLSSVCNLSCRTCTPALSTRMLKEYRRNFEALDSGRQNLVQSTEKMMEGGNLGDSRFFLDQVNNNVENIDFLELRGGEVLADKAAVEFLDDFSKRPGVSNRVKIEISNNVVTLKERHIEIFNRFKGKYFKCSIDSVGIENEYIRYPSKWEDTVAGFDRAMRLNKDYIVFIQPVISVFQALTIDKLLWFVEEKAKEHGRPILFSFCLARDTPHFVHELNPLQMRKETVARVQEFVEKAHICTQADYKEYTLASMKSLVRALLSDKKPTIEDHTEFIRHTKMIDGFRKQSFSKVFPHLAFLLEEDNKGQTPDKRLKDSVCDIHPT